ncbi:MAG: hypothetical protein OHK0039_04300 [Bacteroidia bacterium]
MSRPWTFVVPPPDAFPSGGNLYNAHLLAALASLGHPVTVRRWEDGVAAAGIGWYDSLYLPHLLAQPPAADVPSLLVVHHLPSMELHGAAQAAYVQTQEAPVLGRMAGFLATSTFTRDYLHRWGYGQRPVLVVPPALIRQPAAARSAGGPPQVLMVANLIPRKGILALLKTLADWPGPLPSFVLMIVGSDALDPAYARACRALVDASAPLRARVRFTGALAPAAVHAHYAAATVFVSAAEMETFGMAVQEALAYGLPVLARAGGYLETLLAGRGHVFASLPDLVASLLASLARPETCRRTPVVPATYTWQHAAVALLDQFAQHFPSFSSPFSPDVRTQAAPGLL